MISFILGLMGGLLLGMSAINVSAKDYLWASITFVVAILCIISALA